ncbi:hypothetical protein GCM10023186_26920 [Hymenobacter koreensis]|uniref:Uncharacterized protein n=1 Tax=Hymenobacter koreensis TaxID=1084523 RepID=A0ABP8J4L6_9BACT
MQPFRGRKLGQGLIGQLLVTDETATNGREQYRGKGFGGKHIEGERAWAAAKGTTAHYMKGDAALGQKYRSASGSS